MAIYFSLAGLQKLKEELEYRKNVLRTEIAKKLQDAKALGDISENAEYDEAVKSQAFNEGRIAELEEMVKTAVVIEEGQMSSQEHRVVDIGSSIKVESKNGNQQFTIVGSAESDPTKGFISNESPLGQAFLGRAKGDRVEVAVPKGKIAYKILEIQ